MAKKIRDTETQLKRLRVYNIVAAFAHLGQAVAMIAIITALDAKAPFPVTADYMSGPPGSPEPVDSVKLFDVDMGYGLIGFLMLSAFFHFLVASPAFFNRY